MSNYVAIYFQPGDRGEWESVESVHGLFATRDEAFNALEPYNSAMYSARTSPYVFVVALSDLGSSADDFTEDTDGNDHHLYLLEHYSEPVISE